MLLLKCPVVSPAVTGITGAFGRAGLRCEGYQWSTVLRALSIPALVIQGERDALPVTVVHELPSRARYALIDHPGHTPFREAHQRFAG